MSKVLLNSKKEYNLKHKTGSKNDNMVNTSNNQNSDFDISNTRNNVISKMEYTRNYNSLPNLNQIDINLDSSKQIKSSQNNSLIKNNMNSF